MPVDLSLVELGAGELRLPEVGRRRQAVGLVIADALALLSAEHSAVVLRSYCAGWSTAQDAESTLTSRVPWAVRTPQAKPTFSW